MKTKNELTQAEFEKVYNNFKKPYENRKIISAITKVFIDRIMINDIILSSLFKLKKTKIRKYLAEESLRTLGRSIEIEDLLEMGLINFKQKKAERLKLREEVKEAEPTPKKPPYPIYYLLIMESLLKKNPQLQLKRKDFKSFLGSSFKLNKSIHSEVLREMQEFGLLINCNKIMVTINRKEVQKYG